MALVPRARSTDESDYESEFLDLILAVKVVAGLEEAIEHIRRNGTRHSEAIVTRDYGWARAFLGKVDAACVYVNAATRFTDGFQFVFGAEIGTAPRSSTPAAPWASRP